jgi:signal transduction histidine kinase/ActR/RegA family two-component response regulator
MNFLSIKRKLLLITIVSSAVALLLVAIAFVLLEYFSFRQGMRADFSTLTQIVGDQSTAALTYDDPATAAENLKTLASKKAGIVAACLYTNNSVFASYRVPGSEKFSLPAHPGLAGWQFAAGHFAGFQPVMLNGEQIGTIYVCSDLKELYLMLLRYAAIILIFTSSSLLAAYVLASRLQGSILRSISSLAQTAQMVSSGKNYSVRAVKDSRDELGQLIDDFNGMLAQIQARDLALNRVNGELEKRVEARTLDLQQQLDRISLLNQITIAVAARQDSESIVMVVLQQLELYLQMDYSSAYWFEAVSRTLKVMARSPKTWDLAERFQLPTDLRLADTAFEICAEGGMVYLPDLSRNHSPVAQQISRFENFSSLAVPLFLDGKMFGLLVFMRRKLDGFDLAEREFIRSLSTHVALAVRQAQLYQDLQKAYNELHMTQQAITQQERLKALGQMASGIAHDINNALSPIVGFAELLLRIETSLTADGKKYLNYIKTAGEDITHIVAGLREFYRLRDENEALLALNLNDIVEQAVDMTRPRWRDLSQRRRIMIEVRKDLAPVLPEFVGIESEIREALTNLIINAVDAMPAGGTLTIRTRGVASGLVLEVSDTGIGMDEQTRKRCLEPFYSTKGKRGTGLGLAMVYGIMERHEGRIEIESEPGQGATMRLVFPAAKVIPAPLPLAENHAPPGPFRILCIDDEPTVRELVLEMLRHDGHEVAAADGGKSGVAAFQTAQASGKPFDVVITDLGMPHMDGREVAAVLKNEKPQTPVIMLTGWGAFMKEDNVDQVDGILGKPPRIQEIRAMLREVLPAIHSKS